MAATGAERDCYRAADLAAELRGAAARGDFTAGLFCASADAAAVARVLAAEGVLDGSLRTPS